MHKVRCPILKVASWNICGRGTVAVEYLREQRVDVAFLQEAALNNSQAHAKRQYCVRQDGAALHVVDLSGRISIIAEPALGEGTVLPVRIPDFGLRILNVHAVYNREAGESHDYQAFQRCVEAIETYCERYNGPLLVVGDFNASVHLTYDTKQFQRLFQRLAELGMYDQACDDECSESLAGVCSRQHAATRTFRGKDYRIDYVLTNSAARRFTSGCTVGVHGGLSDHRPVFVDVRKT